MQCWLNQCEQDAALERMLAASRPVRATVVSTDSLDEVVAMMEQLRVQEEPLAELMAGGYKEEGRFR